MDNPDPLNNGEGDAVMIVTLDLSFQLIYQRAYD